MPNQPLIVPALRGAFGDWIYYSCVMELGEIASRVNYAQEIHPDEALSQLIQRSLEGMRAKHIASYLTSNEERFFNSLVLATYGGKPDWLELGNFRSNKPDLVDAISGSAADSLGFLSLTGKERIFAIDGQHRLAGIKQAITESDELGTEQIPVLLVGHKKTQAGLQRTRRLFTTLNKTAVPVAKKDIIALDEDDVMAITCRRLVETNASFRSPKIAVIASPAIPAGNKVCLTTISNLYDILKLIFSDGGRSDRHLRFNRPSDERLDQYYELATSYFDALAATFPPVRSLLTSAAPSRVTPRYRTDAGGHILFRPIGLEIVTRTAIALAKAKEIPLAEAVTLLADIPVELSEAPYAGIIWDVGRERIISKGKPLARDLLFHMAGLSADTDKLLKQYRQAISGDSEDEEIELPDAVL
jgi:DNA sulfur modification protein DndB